MAMREGQPQADDYNINFQSRVDSMAINILPLTINRCMEPSVAGGGMTAHTNTHQVTGAATTTAATTNNPDKPKSRKKDKAPRIPPPDLIVDNNGKMSYTRGPPLGEGGFASCFVISDQKNARYAAKVIQKSELQSAKARHKLFAEIKIHQDRNHKNIVKYYHCFEDDNFVYLVLELCESKTLMELIKKRKRLTEPEVRYYIKQIVAGCAYLHEQKIIHRDLKLGNIFLTKDIQVRIGDFGLAAVLLNEGDRKKTICGTPNYIAPEILFDTDNGHSFEVDVWSVGVIMYTLLIGKPPFQTNEVKAIYKKIRDNQYEFPKDVPISEEAKGLIARLLDPKPQSRPSIATVTNHAFFTSGYCPAKLDRSTLETAPNFEREERLFKQARLQQQAQEDWDEQQAASTQPSKRYSEFTTDMLDQIPSTSTSTHPHASGSNHNPTRYTHNDASAPSRQAQQHGNRLQYGDKFKIEMVDGDKITTEIRTMGGPRMRSVPDFQQFSQAHARIQKEQQQLQQRQEATPTGNEFSTTNPLIKTERTTSRLPMPRSRISLPSNVTSFQQGNTSDTDYTQQQPSTSVATPTRMNFKAIQNVSTSRPQSSLAIGASSPNLSAVPRSSHLSQHQRQESQLGTSHSPSPMNRRRSSDMVSIQGGSTFGKTLMDRRQESKRLGIATEESSEVPQSGIDDLFSPVTTTPSRFPFNEENQRAPQQRDAALSMQQSDFRSRHDDLMDIDSENAMDVDQEPSQHLDLIVTKISEIQPAYVPTINQSKRLNGSQMHQEQSPFLASQSRYSDTNGRARYGESTSPSTLIQNVQGVERPASAMQRTFSQEQELAEMGRGMESPRKVSRTHHSQTHQHQSSLDAATSSLHRGMSPFNPTASLSQSQQHSFLRSSQHSVFGSNVSGQTLKHYSSQPLSTHQRHATTTASSSSIRLPSQSAQQWPVDVMGASHNRKYREESISPGSSPKLTHMVPTMSFPLSPTQRPQTLPMERTRSHPPQGRVGLGVSVPDLDDVHGSPTGGLVRPATTEDRKASQRAEAATVQARPPSSLSPRQPTPNQTPGKNIEDPYRYQLSNTLKSRNQQAKQQQMLQQSQLSQSPTPPSPSPAKQMTKIISMSSVPSYSTPMISNSAFSRNKHQDDAGLHQSQQKNMQHRYRQIGSNVVDTSNSESESSMSTCSTNGNGTFERHEARRKSKSLKRLMQQNPTVASNRRRSASIDSTGRRKDEKTELEQDDQDLVSAGGSGTARPHQNGHTKQSNETTMAGMSSGGNSDEQDHVEIPSTSCITTSLSLSVHHEHPTHIQMQQQQQQLQSRFQNTNSSPHPLREDFTPQASVSRQDNLRQLTQYMGGEDIDAQLLTQELGQGQLVRVHSTKQVQKLGSQGETELYIRTMIEERKAGRLEYPFKDLPVQKAPEVFVVRWVNYTQRYGFGFQLSNSVFGVICNDNTTVVLSPNGDDVEIIHGTASLNSGSNSLPPHKKSKSRKDKNDISPKNSQGSSNSSSTTKSPKDNVSLRASDMTSPRSTNTQTRDAMGSSTRLNSTASKTSLSDADIIMYNKLDDEEYLKKLERSYCRMLDFPQRFEKKVVLLNNFKDFMLSCLQITAPWTYVELDLRRNMPFLTDIFQNVHVVSRLSNGVTQVNFADHSKIVLSNRGRVVTFMDNDEKRRRVTMTTLQALSPEFFYDLDDPADQEKTIQDELKQITTEKSMQVTRSMSFNLLEHFGDHRSNGQLQLHNQLQLQNQLQVQLHNSRYERDPRPPFNSETDIDLYLFPRPNLRNQIARASKGILPSAKALLDAGEDATQIEETPITDDDKRVVIRRMTFKTLHREIVLRLRVAQRLMRERAIVLAEEQKEKEKEKMEKEKEKNQGQSKRHQRAKSRRNKDPKDSKEGRSSSKRHDGSSSSNSYNRSPATAVKVEPEMRGTVTENHQFMEHEGQEQQRQHQRYQQQQQHQEDEDEDMLSRVKIESMSMIHDEASDLGQHDVRVKHEDEDVY
ncbi:Cell cycle serine/threonine-protein kinase cdc5/MSD2 [Linnemannia zychae]|nr:Cell cycle serine/threonine-protein kinase cdc5/MSD2 [Linnemannia zychae]